MKWTLYLVRMLFAIVQGGFIVMAMKDNR